MGSGPFQAVYALASVASVSVSPMLDRKIKPKSPDEMKKTYAFRTWTGSRFVNNAQLEIEDRQFQSKLPPADFLG